MSRGSPRVARGEHDLYLVFHDPSSIRSARKVPSFSLVPPILGDFALYLRISSSRNFSLPPLSARLSRGNLDHSSSTDSFIALETDLSSPGPPSF